MVSSSWSSSFMFWVLAARRAPVSFRRPDARARRDLRPRACVRAQDTCTTARCEWRLASRVEQWRARRLNVRPKTCARAPRRGIETNKATQNGFRTAPGPRPRRAFELSYRFRPSRASFDGENVLTERVLASQSNAVAEQKAVIERARELAARMRAAQGRAPSTLGARRRGLRLVASRNSLFGRRAA